MHQDIKFGNSNIRRHRKYGHKGRRLFGMTVIAVIFTTIIGAAYILKAYENPIDIKTKMNIKPESQTPVTDKESVIEISYDYTKTVPESAVVDNDYFDDAVFIGDSRTEGMILNTGLSNAISYVNKGLMVDTVFTEPVINKDGEKVSVMDALRQTDFHKVYIMLGINETGWAYSDIFVERYCEIIDEIKNINPQAIIYVQEILPVTDDVSKTHSYINNKKINEYNSLIRKMAEEKHIYFIDVANSVSDENGCLPVDAAVDGIHLKKNYCEKWLEYLKTHTVTVLEG